MSSSGFQHSQMVFFFQLFFYLIADIFNGLTGLKNVTAPSGEGRLWVSALGKSRTTFLQCVSSVGCLLCDQTVKRSIGYRPTYTTLTNKLLKFKSNLTSLRVLMVHFTF